MSPFFNARRRSIWSVDVEMGRGGCSVALRVGLAWPGTRATVPGAGAASGCRSVWSLLPRWEPPRRLEPAASPIRWWQGPASVAYRAKGAEPMACAPPLAPATRGRPYPRLDREPPRRGHAARSPPRKPAAPGARRQRQLAIVPLRFASSPVTAIPARSGGAASEGRSGEHGAAEQAEGTRRKR